MLRYLILFLTFAAAREIPQSKVENRLMPLEARLSPTLKALNINKLLLLKLKTVSPIYKIPLKYGQSREVEMVPIFNTADIPESIHQYIPTPQGIAGHKDVQFIAIPNQFYRQLVALGLDELKNIEILLNEAEESETGDSTITLVELNVDFTTDSSNLDGYEKGNEGEAVKVEDVPFKSLKNQLSSIVNSSPIIKVSGQSKVEEIPIYLYATNPENDVEEEKDTLSNLKSVKASKSSQIPEGIPIYMYYTNTNNPAAVEPQQSLYNGLWYYFKR